MHSPIFKIVLTVVVAHFLALLSPGPDFMLLVKSGIKNGVRNALGLALGIACANGVYITLCIIGLGEFLMHSLILLRVLKAFGGLFLIYIAVSALRTKKDEYRKVVEIHDISGSKENFSKEFTVGFVSGITNPKNLVFYLSLFSMVLTGGIDQGIKIGLGIWMICLVLFWDSMILLILSKNSVRKVFSGIVFYVDKVAGIVIGILGVKLILSAIKESSI